MTNLPDINSEQREFWSGPFGDSYSERNNSLDKVDKLSKDLVAYLLKKYI